MSTRNDIDFCIVMFFKHLSALIVTVILACIAVPLLIEKSALMALEHGIVPFFMPLGALLILMMIVKFHISRTYFMWQVYRHTKERYRHIVR